MDEECHSCFSWEGQLTVLESPSGNPLVDRWELVFGYIAAQGELLMGSTGGVKQQQPKKKQVKIPLGCSLNKKNKIK